MLKRFIVVFIVLLLVFGGIFAFKYVGFYEMNRYFSHYKPPPVYVSTAFSELKDYSPSIKAIGDVVAVESVEVEPEINGRVVGIYFHSGDFVRRGKLLVKLDDSTERAELKRYRAQLTLAEFNYDKYSRLYRKGAVSRAKYEQIVSTLRQVKASIEQVETVIEKKNIRAPFSGVLGIKNVNLGEYVNPGQPLVSLTVMKPIYVDFSVPESVVTKVKLGQAVVVRSDAYPSKLFRGKVFVISPTADEYTRSVKVRAIVPNRNGWLRPGMFAYVSVVLPSKRVVAVPALAISYNLYGDTVFVVEHKTVNGRKLLVAVRKYVKLGARFGQWVIVKSGLKPHEEVVIAGQLKLRNGSLVVVKNKPYILSQGQ